jgi:hypothetical protein
LRYDAQVRGSCLGTYYREAPASLPLVFDPEMDLILASTSPYRRQFLEAKARFSEIVPALI